MNVTDTPMTPAPSVQALTTYPIAIPWPLQSLPRLPAVPDAVTCARHHARQKLAQWCLDRRSQASELVVGADDQCRPRGAGASFVSVVQAS